MDSDNQEIIFSEAVFCDIGDILTEINSKCSHFKAVSYGDVRRFKHERLTIKNPDINKINKTIDTFINEYDRNMTFILSKTILN